MLQSSSLKSKSKIELMNEILINYRGNITVSFIQEMVVKVFNINLQYISFIGEGTQPLLYPVFIKERLSNEWNLPSDSNEFNVKLMNTSKDDVMDIFLRSYIETLTIDAICKIINSIYGVNLSLISSIEDARISLFSKGQWILKSDKDLFTIKSGSQDIDVQIYPTFYYFEKTGSDQLPRDLQRDLNDLGLLYNNEMKSYYYANPKGESVEDALKGRIMGVVIKCVQQLSIL